ncbi:MAG TPA: porin [Stellaceae bacterium]|nr:porin [Stellaceae bacterium]
MNKSRVCWVLPIVLASTGAAWAADTEIRVYGGVDVSVDYIDNGLKSLPAISSNNSYVGFGGSTTLGPDWRAVAQIEGQADVAATPSVKDTFGFRNSFVGFVNKSWGSIKAGKNDTPYKSSTAAWDPFANTIADYNSIVSNTGGDSRVEFEVRAAHAIWYESPNLGPFQFNLLWSPGQNLAGDNTDFPLGDNTCSGGTFGSSGSGNPGTQNNFGSTGNSSAVAAGQANGVNQPHANNGGVGSNVLGTSTIGSGFGECTDGAFGDLYSGSVIFKQGNFIATAAAELHHAVNRLSDVVPTSGIPNDIAAATFTSSGQAISGLVSTRNEWAAKFGGGYDFGVVKVYALYEIMRRTNMPDDFNERTRDGVYASITWRATEKDDVSFSYNHAFATPGNPLINSTVNFNVTTPAQGELCPQTANPATNTPNNNDDAADQFSLGFRHYFSPAVSVYAAGSYMHNHPCGHFVLGTGGHGIVAAQRNQFNETFPGKDLAGISVGTTFRF